MTLNEYLNKWLETAAKQRLSERVFADYKYLLDLYVRGRIGNKRITDLRAMDIQMLYAEMQEKGLSARTVRYTNAVLSSALKQAVKWGVIVRNPASLVELPKIQRKEMQALSTEDAIKFLEAAAEDRYSVLFSLALITGMRPEEYLGLQWKDIDLQNGVITVQRAVIERNKIGWYFSEPKTARSRRSIPIPQSLSQALTIHRHKQLEERLKAGASYQNYDLVFATGEGTPLLRRNIVRRHFKPILKRAGLPESLRLYDLRHSCATLLLAANENPKVVGERLGHASIRMTMDVYSHVLPTMQRAASDKLEILLSQKTGTQ
jgi:integrase